jgi:hypothetical protein
MLRPTVCRPRLGIEHPPGTRHQLFPFSLWLFFWQFQVLLMWGALSDEKSGLYFSIFAGHRQRSLSQIWVPRDRWSYFIVSILRLPQPGGPGSCIYFLQEQDSPIIPSTRINITYIISWRGALAITVTTQSGRNAPVCRAALFIDREKCYVFQ